MEAKVRSRENCTPVAGTETVDSTLRQYPGREHIHTNVSGRDAAHSLNLRFVQGMLRLPTVKFMCSTTLSTKVIIPYPEAGSSTETFLQAVM